MFYEIINEYCKVTNQKSVWRSYGEDFYRQVYSFGKRDADWKDRSLYLLKDIANKLNVPVSFVMSITNYEGIEEVDEARGITKETTGSPKEEVL